MSRAATAEARWTALVDALASDRDRALARAAKALREAPRSTGRKRFGADALRLPDGGPMFAFVSRGRLVVKLPRARVDELIAARSCQRFDPGHGRIMKEWAAVVDDALPWTELVREAHRHAAKKR
jgi:hypothetical protein